MKKLLGALLAAALLFCQSAFADQPTTVLAEVKSGKQIRMEIPVIDGANDEVFQQAANRILKDAAEEVAAKIGRRGKVEYAVTLNRPSLVSVQLTGVNGSRKYYRYVNLDLAAGREFTLDDFFFHNEERQQLLGNNTENILFTEHGVAIADKRGSHFTRQFSYEEMLPLARIGDIGRLLTVWKLTENSDGKTLKVSRGDLFAFKLNANPSTGFQWMNFLSGGPKNGIAKIGSSFMIPNSQREQTGTPGMEFQFYAAQAAGTYQLKLSYQRPWEKVGGIRECNVTVVVADKKTDME